MLVTIHNGMPCARGLTSERRTSTMTKTLAGIAAITLGLGGTVAMLGNSLSEGTANVAVQWNDAAVASIRATGTPPTVASRALFVVHSAMYDAWAAYDTTAVASIPGAPPRQGASSGTDLNK